MMLRSVLPAIMVMSASLGVVLAYELPVLGSGGSRLAAVTFLILGGVGIFLHVGQQWRRLQDALVDGDQLLRHRRHDYANHLQVLSGWAQLGDSARLYSYVKSITAEVTQESLLCRTLPDLAAAELTRLRLAAHRGGGGLRLEVREIEKLTDQERGAGLNGLAALQRFMGSLTTFPPNDWDLQLTIGGTPEGCPAAGDGCPGPMAHCFCARLTTWAATDPKAALEVAAGQARGKWGRPTTQRPLWRVDGSDILVFPLPGRHGWDADSPSVQGQTRGQTKPNE